MEGVYEGVAIATASAGQPSWDYTVSLLGLRYPAKVFRLKKCEREGLNWGRNDLINWFLWQSRCLYLLLLDDTAVVHPDTIERLMSWNKPLVSCLSVLRSPPHSPVAYQEAPRPERFFPMPQGWLESVRSWAIKHPEVLTPYGTPVVLKPRPEDALVEVRSGSAHCVLIDRDVLEAIEGPWFDTSCLSEGGGGVPLYEKVRNAGFKCYVDRSCVAGHVRSGVAGLLDFAVWDPIAKYDTELEGE